ncbi:MAG: PhzF family phenazine biosynthesis protein [Acidobacteriota bacterium]|nr:PhzF family phenazine biosynthesis protein [Acidobacteriota bacterium]
MTAEPEHPYTVLDVFTQTPLAGNPLAVFTEGETIPSRLMLAAARELHLSETVFVLPGDDQVDVTLRIFTPQAELPFAGHPVLGSAFVVGEQQDLATVRLRTGAGIVPVKLTREHGEIVYGEMEQPLPTVGGFEREQELLAALGLSAAAVALPIEAYTNGPTHVIVAVVDPRAGTANAEAVAGLAPDMAALRALGTIGVTCFARIGDGRVKSRVFCPGMGIPEDPATGSAAGPLALHLARHGWHTPGRPLTIVQGVELQRPSELVARVDGTAEHPTRITVGGSAVVVAQGRFRLQ